MKLTTFFSYLWSKKQTKIIVASALVGGVAQLVSRQYLKNHPELADDNNNSQFKEQPKPLTSNKDKNIKRRIPKFFLSPKGGAFLEFSSIKISTQIGKLALNYIAKRGLVAAVIASTSGVIITTIPYGKISKYVYGQLPDQKTRFIVVIDGEKTELFGIVEGRRIYLDSCDNSFRYLFTILDNPSLTRSEKRKLAEKIFSKYFDKGSTQARINCIICVSLMLAIFFTDKGKNGFKISLDALMKALKNGTISKRATRLLLRKLRRLGVNVDSDLLEAVEARIRE